MTIKSFVHFFKSGGSRGKAHCGIFKSEALKLIKIQTKFAKQILTVTISFSTAQGENFCQP